MVPEAGIQNEFLGAMQRIQKWSRKQMIEQMLAKASQSGLSQEEKETLRELINEN